MRSITKNLVLSAIFLDLGLLLPFVTGQIPQFGKMLLPMHIPILLCGLICGWKYGFVIGLITPLLRSIIFGMPVLYPNAITMAFELATYGLTIGLVYQFFNKKNLIAVYISLFSAMFVGRIVLAISQIILFGIAKSKFSFQVFIGGAFINAIPGIIVQIIFIPIIMSLLDRIGFNNGKKN